MELQVRMYQIGFLDFIPDGTFDMRTENAVRQVQSARGLDNDGVVNLSTWEAIVWFEQQNLIEYQYGDPSDGRSQIVFDLQRAEQQAQWDAQNWQDNQAYEPAYVEGQVSDDGRWQLRDGVWHEVGGADATADQGAPATVEVGTISDDGYYRWDGNEWEVLTAESFIGQLSPDGSWRWDGSNWQPT